MKHRIGEPDQRVFTPLARQFGIAALAGAIVLLGVYALVLDAAPMRAITLAFAVYAGSTLVVAEMMRRTYPHAVLGLCNAVTLLRLVLVAALGSALIYEVADPWRIVAVAGVALALDGVDGWLARREGLVSAFGARFDMEVDAALALVLSIYALGADLAGPLVLILGLARYAFVVAASLAPWLRRPLPERFSRKAICVVQIGTLIGVQIPLISRSVADAAVLVASAALIWSFARDILWAWRNRA